jgi:membrane protein YdbS with pleckstrin-like domain
MLENAQQPDAAIRTSAAFRQLDPRVVKLWRSVGLITAGVFLLALLVAAITAGAIYPELSLWLLLLWVLLLVACAWLVYWRPPRLYRSWGYRIDERVLETRSGLLFQVRQLLPLTRLQHVDLHRGPIERAYGLATLVLHTAGTQEARITIPGLDADEAARLRDHLVEVGGDDAV